MTAAPAPLRLLVTGGTGFLGARLVWAIWRAGNTAWLLTRNPTPPAMRAHLAGLVGLFGGSARRTPPAPTWLPGNLWLPLAGVSADWIATWRGQIDAVVHLAADTRLRPVRIADQTRTNVDGSEHVADLVEALECPALHHVSACTVAGSWQGTWREDDLDRGQDFRTHFEWSKAEAEKRLRARASTGRFRLTVHRPATLVGDSATGGAATFPVFYQLLQAWQRLADSGARGGLLIPFSAEAAIPLITVDHVAEGILAAMRDADAPGMTFHWSPHTPLTLAALSNTLARLLGTAPLEFDPMATWPMLDESSPAQPLWEWLHHHRAYLSGGLILDRTNADALCQRHGLATPEIDAAILARLHQHWAWATGRETQAPLS